MLVILVIIRLMGTATEESCSMNSWIEDESKFSPVIAPHMTRSTAMIFHRDIIDSSALGYQADLKMI